jgi:ribosome-associated heat shock protein Hsp15
MGDPTRIDKWLWCIRAYKTRSDAAEACKSGRVKVNNMEAKASRELNAGDSVSLRKPPATYTFKVVDFPPSRVAAALVARYAEDLTPQSELDKLSADRRNASVYRERGAGRPTKKERRQLNEAMNSDETVW